MFGFKFEELLLVLVIILVLFGGKKLPELSKGIGQAIKEIRKGFTDKTDDDEKKKKKSEKSDKA
jgi:sec-independent protein translocase protein TatA